MNRWLLIGSLACLLIGTTGCLHHNTRGNCDNGGCASGSCPAEPVPAVQACQWRLQQRCVQRRVQRWCLWGRRHRRSGQEDGWAVWHCVAAKVAVAPVAKLDPSAGNKAG